MIGDADDLAGWILVITETQNAVQAVTIVIGIEHHGPRAIAHVERIVAAAVGIRIGIENSARYRGVGDYADTDDRAASEFNMPADGDGGEYWLGRLSLPPPVLTFRVHIPLPTANE